MWSVAAGTTVPAVPTRALQGEMLSEHLPSTGLVDNVLALSLREMPPVQSWLPFCIDSYDLVGKLLGQFCDENGAPTEALRQAEAAVEEAQKFQAEGEQSKLQFPPCNSEWSSVKGSCFWCSRQSGRECWQPQNDTAKGKQIRNVFFHSLGHSVFI